MYPVTPVTRTHDPRGIVVGGSGGLALILALTCLAFEMAIEAEEEEIPLKCRT